MSQVFDRDYLGGAVLFKVKGLLEDGSAHGEKRYTVCCGGDESRCACMYA